MAFSFRKSSKSSSKPTDSIQARLAEVRQETHDAVTLVFEKDPRLATSQAGQFLTLIFDLDGKKVKRSYSLCSYGEELPAVSVKRVEGGLVSNHVADTLQAGDEVEVYAPMGQFRIEGQNIPSGRVRLFIGGGSGITPLLSMIKKVLAEEPNTRIGLIYVNRTEKDIIFEKALKQLEAEHSDRFRVIHQLTRPGDGWQGLKGRPNASTLKPLIFNLQGSDDLPIDFYLCGPDGLMDEVKACLKALDVADSQVHFESFTSAENQEAPSASAAAAGEGTPVTVILDGEEHQVNVEKKSILFTGLDQGLDMPYSCQNGVCTACMGKLVEGDIEMRNQQALTDSEIDQGFRLTCVGFPKGPVKIDMD